MRKSLAADGQGPSGANIGLVFHSFDFCADVLVSASFHTREIVKEGVGHLRSYRKSTESLGKLNELNG